MVKSPTLMEHVSEENEKLRAENERLREALRDANRRARRALGGDYHYKQTLKVICRKTSEAAESLTDSEEASREED